MSDTEMSKATAQRTSTLRRIKALRCHTPLFNHIAMKPQSGLYDRLGKQWPMVVAAIEGEVYERVEIFEKFIFKDSNGIEDSGARAELWEATTSLADAMIYRSKVIKAWQAAALAPSVSARSMVDYCISSGFTCGNDIAANGQSASMYDMKGTGVPDAYAAICHADFDRLEQFVENWMMQPFLDFVSKPIRSILLQIPGVRRRFRHQSAEVPVVGANTIAGCSRLFMVMVAVLCAAAAIFTLNRVKKRQMRIVVMGLFALAFSMPLQLLSPRSLPMYTLILS
ncbi:hypothetical protein DE146DRAFT_364418 [Phaeosphaeria sp. MPI-PUGE-AT-0046c]|nr:hypothetical protein DE146DRAFT_364418 [Phaeosphaeria sp. MPI-PUGE-AT-0046c]